MHALRHFIGVMTAILMIAVIVLITPAGARAQGPPPPPGLTADAVPASKESVTLDQRLGAALPLAAVFTDERGRDVRLGDYFGSRPVVLAFVYFDCPMLCSQVLQGLLRGLRPLDFTIGREFDLVVVSIDPSDAPGEARAQQALYARRYGRDGAAGLHFLTGSPNSIASATAAAGFRFRYDADQKLFFHPAAVMVVTPSGKVSRYLTGIDFAPRDLEFALMDASASRIGSISARLQLYCYRYDPSRGRYSLLVFNLLRGGAAIAAGALVTLLAGAWWRERRERRGRAV